MSKRGMFIYPPVVAIGDSLTRRCAPPSSGQRKSVIPSPRPLSRRARESCGAPHSYRWRGTIDRLFGETPGGSHPLHGIVREMGPDDPVAHELVGTRIHRVTRAAVDIHVELRHFLNRVG